MRGECADDSFLTNFAKKPFTVNEQIKLIHDFLAVSPESSIDDYQSRRLVNETDDVVHTRKDGRL